MMGSEKPHVWAGTRPALCAATVLLAWLAGRTPVMQALEHRMVDLRLRMVARGVEASPEVVLIALDNSSLERLQPDLGRWPWPRAVFAGVLDYCADAAVVGFDILFAEPDWQWPERDQALVEEVRRHGRVVTPLFLEPGGDPSVADQGVRAKAAMPQGESAVEWPRFRRSLSPYAELLEASRSLGHVNHESDGDGVARRYMIAARQGDLVVPSLGLATVSLYLETQGRRATLNGRRLETGAKAVSLTDDGRMRLTYTDCRYRIFSLADVLASWQMDGDGPRPVEREAFAGKMVLIGSTATGLEADMQVTPVARSLPGLLVHANAIDGLLNGRSYRVPPAFVDFSLLALLAVAPFLSGLARPARMAVFGLGLFALYASAAVGVMAALGWMLPVVHPLLGLLGATGGLSVLYWHREAGRRRYLESLEAAKQQFTDMLVHDLKNRVGAITMSLSMMKTHEAAADEEMGRMIRTAQVSGARVLAQAYALLDIRKMEEGRLALQRKPADVWDLLQECAREHEEAGELLNARVAVVRNAADALWVEVDAEVVSRILGNLVWNALNYARRGTEVQLLARRGGTGRVEIFVANEGRNIPKDQQTAVFEAFVAGVSGAKQGKGPSIGLGLAFCRLACEAHGATIRVESPWEDGTQGVRMVMSFPPLSAGVASA